VVTKIIGTVKGKVRGWVKKAINAYTEVICIQSGQLFQAMYTNG